MLEKLQEMLQRINGAREDNPSSSLNRMILVKTASLAEFLISQPMKILPCSKETGKVSQGLDNMKGLAIAMFMKRICPA